MIGTDGYTYHTRFADRAMRDNDMEGVSARDRERRLIKLFRENGIKLRFKGRTK